MLADLLQPVWAALFEKTGVFGIFIATMAPFLFIGLLILILGIIIAVFGQIRQSGLRKILKKANAYEQEGRYEEAWVQMRNYLKKVKPTAEEQYHMAMLCIAGEQDGWDLEDEQSSPRFWLKQAAKTYPLAEYQLVKRELETVFPRNLLNSACAVGKLRKLAEQGISEAAAFLETFEREQVGKANLRQAERLAVLGDGEKQYHMGIALDQIGKMTDGMQWYLLAAENGYTLAQRTCAKIYKNGAAGIPKDSKKAIAWYEKAATGGDLEAAFVLGNLYATGDGCRKDYEQAAKWYEKAAEKANAEAEHNAAVCYYRLAEARAEEKGLKTKLDGLSDTRYFALWSAANNWQKKAEEHGYRP